MSTDRETAEHIAINALGWNDRAELDPGEKLAFGMWAADIERALFDARADERAKVRREVGEDRELCPCGYPGPRENGRCPGCGNVPDLDPLHSPAVLRLLVAAFKWGEARAGYYDHGRYTDKLWRAYAALSPDERAAIERAGRGV